MYMEKCTSQRMKSSVTECQHCGCVRAGDEGMRPEVESNELHLLALL